MPRGSAGNGEGDRGLEDGWVGAGWVVEEGGLDVFVS